MPDALSARPVRGRTLLPRTRALSESPPLAGQSRDCMHIGLNKLYVFYLAARYGSMKKAAARLYVSPPAVTMQLRKLEEETGLQLFARPRSPLRLTRHGEELYSQLAPVFQRLDEVRQRLADMARVENRVLRLGAHHLPARYFMPDLIGLARERQPTLRVRITLDIQDLLLEKLLSHELDLALIIGEPPDARFAAVPLCTADLLLVTARPDLAPSGRLRLRDLNGMPMLLQQHGSGARRTIQDWLRRAGVRPEIRMDNMSSDVLKQFLPRVPSVAFIARFIAQEDVDAGRLRELVLEDAVEPPHFLFQLVRLADERPSEMVARFLADARDFPARLP